MKNQVLFSSKDKTKKLKCRLLQFLFGTLRVKPPFSNFYQILIYNARKYNLNFGVFGVTFIKF